MEIIFKLREKSRTTISFNFSLNKSFLNKYNNIYYFFLIPTNYTKRISKQESKNLFYVKFEWLFWYFKIDYIKYKK